MHPVVVLKEVMIIEVPNQMTRSQKIRSAHAVQRRNTKLAVEQPLGDLLLSLELINQLTLEKVERNGSKARRVDLLKPHQPVELMEGYLTWVHFVFDLDLNQKTILPSLKESGITVVTGPYAVHIRWQHPPVLVNHV